MDLQRQVHQVQVQVKGELRARKVAGEEKACAREAGTEAGTEDGTVVGMEGGTEGGTGVGRLRHEPQIECSSSTTA